MSTPSDKRAVHRVIWRTCQIGGIAGAAVVWVLGMWLRSRPGGAPVPVWVCWPTGEVDEGGNGAVPHPVAFYLLVGVGLPVLLRLIDMLTHSKTPAQNDETASG